MFKLIHICKLSIWKFQYRTGAQNTVVLAEIVCWTRETLQCLTNADFTPLMGTIVIKFTSNVL